MSALSDTLSELAQQLPAVWRKRVYKGVKILAGLATLVLLVLPLLPGLGINWTDSARVGTILSFVIALLGHLADSNLHPVDGS